MTGCSYGKVTRQMVISNRDTVNEIKEDVKLLTNHYSNRIPLWAVSLITILSSLVVGVITWGLS